MKTTKSEQELRKWLGDKLTSKISKFEEENSIELFKSYQASQGQDSQACFPLIKFFQENSTEVFSLNADGDQYEMFESMRIYIERFGRPYNYLASVNYLNRQREDYLLEEEQKEAVKSQEVEVKQKKEVETQKKALEELVKVRMQFVMEHMKDLEGCDDMNMRQFLMKCIIPLLTEGMIDVWKVGPLDPVDYLADYIFKKSNGV